MSFKSIVNWETWFLGHVVFGATISKNIIPKIGAMISLPSQSIVNTVVLVVQLERLLLNPFPSLLLLKLPIPLNIVHLMKFTVTEKQWEMVM